MVAPATLTQDLALSLNTPAQDSSVSFSSLRGEAPRRETTDQSIEDFRASLNGGDATKLNKVEVALKAYQEAYKTRSPFSPEEMECENHLKYLTKPGANWDCIPVTNKQDEVVGGLHLNLVKANLFSRYGATAHVEQFWVDSTLSDFDQKKVVDQIFAKIQEYSDRTGRTVVIELKDTQLLQLPESAKVLNFPIEQCSFDSPEGNSVKGLAYAVIAPSKMQSEINAKNLARYLSRYQDWADPADRDMARMKFELSGQENIQLISPEEFIRQQKLSKAVLTGVSSEFQLRGPLECLDRLPTEAEREQMCRDARRAVTALLRAGKGIEFDSVKHGVEIEFSLVDAKTGRLAIGSVPKVRAQLGDPRIHSEAGTVAIEIASDPFEGPGSYVKLLEQVESQFEIIKREAQKIGCVPIMTGVAPILHKGELNRKGMLDETLQIKMEGEYWENVGGDEPDPGIQINTKRGAPAYHFDDGVNVWSALNSLHVTSGTYNQDHAVTLYNAYVALTPLFMSVSANAGSINGKTLEAKDIRPFLCAWDKDDFTYGKEYSLGTTVSFINSIHEGFEAVLPEKPTIGCPTIQLSSGATPNARDAFETIREITYPSVHLRLAKEDPRQILVEYRPMSVQLTPKDNIAMAMFVRIAAEYLAQKPEGFAKKTEGIVTQDIRKALTRGMGANIIDVSSPDQHRRAPAHQIAADLLERSTEWALKMGMINQADLEVLKPLRERIANRETCADTVRNTIREKGIKSGVLALSGV